jgi:antitoxin (DNA-binding transcriptional repressor) of toxin-antitoxin stability system
MKLENVKVGEVYTLKVGKNMVAVKAMSVDAKGKITVSPASGKMITVADAGRLTARTVADDAGRHTAKQAAHGAPRKPSTPKATKAASGRNVGQQGAPKPPTAKEGSLMAAAINVMKAADKPMRPADVVETVLAKKLWTSKGKTPGATLAAAIMREIARKGSLSRFKKTGPGLYALNA